MALPIDLIESGFALFVDFDGTIAEIAERPEAVVVRASTSHALAVLLEQLGGALAIVTGRELQAIDRFLSPMTLPVAGVHGLVRRDANGNVHAASADTGAVARIETALREFAGRNPGLLVEPKGLSVALHYRARPDLADECAAVMSAAVSGMADIEIKRGHCVLEAKPSIANKGAAIRDFMTEPPFLGRRPVFAGDDVTDEDGFAAVNDLGGVTIKIGPEETLAQHRVADTNAFLDWLEASAARLEG